MKRFLPASLLAVLAVCAPALALAQTYTISVPVQVSHIMASGTKLAVVCDLSAAAKFAPATPPMGNYVDFVLDSTGSYNGTITVTIQAPVLPHGSYGCAIFADPHGNGNFDAPNGLPQVLLNGVQGPLPS